MVTQFSRERSEIVVQGLCQPLPHIVGGDLAGVPRGSGRCSLHATVDHVSEVVQRCPRKEIEDMANRTGRRYTSTSQILQYGFDVIYPSKIHDFVFEGGV